ncbi:hypothetical protein HUJ04_000500 [Dendroctonus ponderosae]|nr:hypothetical protein HUJ04_000500 [Dendroctonus ponderosae]
MPETFKPNHSSQSNAHVSAAELYKSSRSPLSNSRCAYPPTSQLQPNPPNIPQVQVSQRYPTQGPAASVTAPAASSLLSPATAYHRPQLDYRHTNRISLLHPEYGPGGRREAASGGAGGQPPPTSSSEQPLKKIRLADEMQPLRIDTRPGTYNPQVEAISPIFPEPISQEDQVFKTTKDRLIQQISKVDREILKAEQQIVILKKKQAELEEVANKPTVSKEVEEDAVPKNQSLPQKIYADNRRRAQSAHALLDCLGPKVEWPLYNQPTDTTVIHENIRRNVMFKKRLLEYFKKKHAERQARNNQLSATYSKLMQEWIRKCDKIESSTKRKAKEAKNREFFERTFPEVRRKRENKERFNRVGSRVKSEAEMDDFSEQQEQDNADRRMRSYAVIPPILLDPKEKRIKYTNNNNFVEDMEEVYQSRQYLNIWTAQEKEIFKEKYLQHPKNFYQISQALGEKKSVSECVRFYYLSKKTENYKRLLRKNRRDKLREKMRQSRNSGKINNNANLSVVDNLSTGVTTRLQREQQQRTEGSARSSDTSTSAVTAVSAEAATTTSSPPPPAIGTTAALSPLNAGATTTSSSTSTTTSGTNVLSSEWSGTTITSTAQIPTSVSQSVTTITTTTSSTAAVTSLSPSSPISSSVGLTTTATNTTSTTVSSIAYEVSNPENATSKDIQGVKFSDFNSFEDFNNREFSGILRLGESYAGMHSRSSALRRILFWRIAVRAAVDAKAAVFYVKFFVRVIY